MRKSLLTIACLLVLGVISRPAMADSIGGDCGAGNCLGVIYTLNYNPTPISQTATTSTYLITLTMDTSGINNGATLLQAVAFKVVSGNSSDYGTVTLESAPNGVADWTTVVGGEANGCSAGNAGFVCSQTIGFAQDLAVGSGSPIYHWSWDVEVANGTLTTGPLGAHVKDSFGIVDPKTGGFKQHGQTSADITLQPLTPTPEPASLLMLVTGLAGVASRLRRHLS